MAAHFLYKHLPASGLGKRDPLRPYATGGLGGATFLAIYIALADYLLYRSTLTEGIITRTTLLDTAGLLVTEVVSTIAALDEASGDLSIDDDAALLTSSDDAADLDAKDEAEGATMSDNTTVSMVADRTTVVTLTDTKVE